MTIIDGKKVANKWKEEIKEKIEKLNGTPRLDVIRIGEDEASKVYVTLKHKMCEELGMNFTEHHLNETITQEELISLINKLNNDKSVNAISTTRAQLISKGIIYPVRYKELDFTVPEFTGYIQRLDEYKQWCEEN